MQDKNMRMVIMALVAVAVIAGVLYFMRASKMRTAEEMQMPEEVEMITDVEMPVEMETDSSGAM